LKNIKWLFNLQNPQSAIRNPQSADGNHSRHR
jgi:hypothetical protein